MRGIAVFSILMLVPACAETVGGSDGGTGGTGGTSGGQACTWDRGGAEGEVRVHVGNVNDAPGIRVALSGGGLSCIIEDENKVLQVPIFGSTFPPGLNTVPEGDTFGGLGQALMPVEEGDAVTIGATYQDTMAIVDCGITAEAFESGNPLATAGQAFLDVTATVPPTITCGIGMVAATQ